MQFPPTVLDLFCGAGGLALGFIGAGFEIVGAVDNDCAAVETYRANIASHAVARDLRECHEFPAATVIIGGPPCQGFSSAGLRRAEDQRNALVRRFAAIVVAFRPMSFVFENVEGFLTGDKGSYVFDLLEPLVAAGYRIHLRKVNAANYGVPQHRKRVVAIGGLGWDPSFPIPTHAAFGAPGAELTKGHLPMTPTLTDALRGLPSPFVVGRSTPTDHVYRPLSGVDLERARTLRPGQSMRDLPPALWHDSFRKRANRRVMDGTPSERRGGAPHGIRRLLPDEPCKAVTGGARAEFLHPFEDRHLTLRELARIQTFPDDFEFRGTVVQRERLIGNAVPPLLALAIARNLAADLQIAKPGTQNGALLSFVPTLSVGTSPALDAVTKTIISRFNLSNLRGEKGGATQRPLRAGRKPAPAEQLTFWERGKGMALTQAQRAIVSKARAIGGGEQGVALGDDACAYLVAVIAKDLGLLEHFNAFPGFPRDEGDLPDFFETRPLSRLSLPEVDFMAAFQYLVALDPNADTYFSCLATLHKSRLKYERILETQPLPTIDQVGPRGLLQYGGLSPQALTGFLFWRKWLFDIDNRAGQETGYLFEPIIASAIGGTPAGTRRSPIYREGDPTKGQRQVDCIRDDKAYEFKLRVTIAASGQGRWQEELDFPRDCRASGFIPILIVLDPTRNAKLDELERAFRANGGEVHVEDAWQYLDRLAGETMAKFLNRYVHEPIRRLLAAVPESATPADMALPELSLTMSRTRFKITVGDEVAEVRRVPRTGGDTHLDSLPDDVDSQTPGP
jgi:DNA (cytosine-5)-methyltransferase 1